MGTSLVSGERIATMQGKICMITGANSGIGKETALELAAMGAKIIMVCRDRAKGEAAMAEIARRAGGPSSSSVVDLFVADMASLASVRALAQEFKSKYDRLDVLINNAGLARMKRSLTEDGFETTFQVNYLSQFLLTNLLLDTLKSSAPSRIVIVSSDGHYSGHINFDDLQKERKYTVFGAYNQSKLAQVLFTYELARKLQGSGVTVNCLHPGTVRTNIWNNAKGPVAPFVKFARLFMRSTEKGAETVVYLASSDEVQGVSGKYFYDKKERRSSSESYEEEKAKRLWQVSEKLVGL